MPAPDSQHKRLTSASLCASVVIWLIATIVTGIALAQGEPGPRTVRNLSDSIRATIETERVKEFDKAVKAYERGDYPTTLRLLRPLAKDGNPEAQNNLGLMYAAGRGVPQDYAAAAKWYRMAADKGVASAQNNLAVLYAGGQGVDHDYVKAYMWFTLAASRFNASEAEERNKVIKNRDALAADMMPEQITEAQKLAREWKRK